MRKIEMKNILCIVLCISFVFTLTSCAEKKEEHYYDDIIVYVSRYGKIHSNSSCSGMIYYTSMPLSSAISKGFIVCKKCENDICEAINEYNKHSYGNYDCYTPKV